MLKYVKFKKVFIASMLFISFFYIFSSIQKSAEPESVDSIDNKNLPIKDKSKIQSEDPVYKETGGLYTEEDFESAIPADMPSLKK
ncbi:hypothetical protein [Metabacillus malikii]|uniref:Uncharacterized protein n=1 Tax=Metabacillus malikii TaxID=1504265 RepID=A0ABT9ZLC7_9BACI|nr:hypothetical protein [Metabacillus malikii]MDQ0232699.1 hypothetical protein [Metabacillus malikii]